jgi:hypothetical protein
VDRIISNEGNGPPRGPNFAAPTGAGGSMFEMMVPGHKVGLIIGKAGETIKQLQEQSGAKIVIIQVIIYRSNILFLIRLARLKPCKKTMFPIYSTNLF